MIDDYLSDRWAIYEGEKCFLVEEIRCGTAQGSRVGPLMWNVMSDDFLRMTYPLEWASLTSRRTHLLCAPLKTSKSWSQCSQIVDLSGPHYWPVLCFSRLRVKEMRGRLQIQNAKIYNLRYYSSLLDIFKNIHLKWISEHLKKNLERFKHLKNHFPKEFNVIRCLKFQMKVSTSIFVSFNDQLIQFKIM